MKVLFWLRLSLVLWLGVTLATGSFAQVESPVATEPGAADPAGPVPAASPAGQTASNTTARTAVTVHLDLLTSLRTAVDNSARLAEVLARVREARYKVDEAYVLAYPTAGFSATYNNLVPAVQFPSGDGRTIVISQPNNYNLALTIQQALYTFGRLKWGTEMAEMTERSVKEEYRREAEQLLEDTAEAFYAVLGLEDGVVIARDRVKAQEAQLTDSRNLFEAGVAARFDVLRSEAELTRVRNNLIKAEKELSVARSRLLTALGLDPSLNVELERPRLPGAPPTDLEGATQQALELRPEMAVLRWSVAAGRARIGYEDSQNSPQLSLQTQGTRRNATGFSPADQLSTSLVFSIPLFDGGASEARRNQAVEVVSQLEEALERTRRQVELEVREAFTNLQNSYLQIEVAQKNVEQAAEALRVARVRYQNGVSTNVELLSAQTSYSDAQYNEALARFEYQSNWARWRRAISAAYPVVIEGPINRTPNPVPDARVLTLPDANGELHPRTPLAEPTASPKENP